MCGICGIVLSDPNARVNPRVIERMSDAIAHRGPDDDGQYLNGRVYASDMLAGLYVLNAAK